MSTSELVFCTLPEPDDGCAIVYGFSAQAGGFELGCYMLSQGTLQGIAPIYSGPTIASGLDYLATTQEAY